MKRLLSLARRLSRPGPRLGSTPHDVVHTENKLRLLHYRPRPEGLASATPVLLVPSLINRHYVLDLMEGQSFVEWMVARGHDVYLIDWGTPGDEDRFLSLDEITDRYLGRCLRVVTRRAGTQKAHVLGYCLGGTLATMHTAVRPQRVASLVALAAPIDFHDGGILSAWTRCKSFDLDALLEAEGNVPWPIMQTAFHMLRPTLAVAKLVRLFDRGDDAHFLEGFLATERWGNDNVEFPGEAYRKWLGELYRDNALVRGELRLGGEPVRLGAIECPTLVVTFEADHIVPAHGATVLARHISSEHRRLLSLPGGHIGAVVSRRARRSLWPQLSAFWLEHDPARVAAANRPPAHHAASG